MQMSSKEEVFIKQPYFEGGPKALTSFIISELKYPQDAEIENIKGIVKLYLSIDHNGNVVDSEVLASLHKACDAEAIRVAKRIKFIVPKTPRKLKLLFHKRLSVSFQPPKKAKAAPQIQFNYAIKAELKNQELSAKPSAKYSYSIIIEKK